jgi:hypothetical protein
LDYKSTATYYWSLIAENGFVSDSVTGFLNGLPGESANGNDVEAVAGPFGFDEAIKLGEKQCVIKSEFKNQNDECIVSPKNCPDGISFSIWEKAMYSEDVLQVMADHERKYILSTGGQFNDSSGVGTTSPGVSLYHEGMDLVAIVSTGDDVWKLQVRGQLENETWSNIGVVWKPNTVNADDNVEGGLTLYVMSEKVGHSVLPIPNPDGGEWQKEQRASIDAPLASKGTPNTHEVPFISIGCRVRNGEPLDHIRPNTALDELTIWNKALSTNRTVDETIFPWWICSRL